MKLKILSSQAKLKKFKRSERENKRKKMSLMEQQLDREEERLEADDSDDEVSEVVKKEPSRWCNRLARACPSQQSPSSTFLTWRRCQSSFLSRDNELFL